MKRDNVLRVLGAHRGDLKAFGVKTLALFGSVARGEASRGSDLDFLVEFESPASFDHYMGLKLFLEDLFECQVDLVTRKALKPLLRPLVEEEAIYVP
jgi:predicted nucleotidyltransferase